MIYRIIAALAVATTLPACATITRGTKQAFIVTSEPPGADVALSNGMRCKTPCSLKIKRKDPFSVKITKDGYEPIEANIVSQMSSGGGMGMAGNILFGGLIGGIVDGTNGATNDLRPNPLAVNLVARTAGAPSPTAMARDPAFYTIPLTPILPSEK